MPSVTQDPSPPGARVAAKPVSRNPRRLFTWALIALAPMAVAALALGRGAGEDGVGENGAGREGPVLAVLARPGAEAGADGGADRAGNSASAKLLDPSEVTRVTPRDMAENLALSAELRPLRRVTVSAEIGGIAEEVGPRAGEEAAAGRSLVVIAASDYRLALEAEEAGLRALVADRALAGLTLERASQLEVRGATARMALDEAGAAVVRFDAQIAAAETRIALARANLERTEIAAPFAGRVISRSVEPGQRVNAGDALYDIADLSSVTLNALVPVAVAQGLQPGALARFWLPDTPSVTYEARLVRIGGEAATGTRAVPLWFELDNSLHRLPSGSFLKGSLALREEAGVFVLPQTALREGPDGVTVLAIRNGIAVELPAEPGAAWPGGLITITAGLSTGDEVVHLPLAGLSPGDRVRADRSQGGEN